MGLTPVLSLPYPEPGDTADVPRDMRALALAIEAQGVLPPGVMQMWPGTVAPTGWAICNGATVDAAANPKLVAIFGSAGGLVTLPNLAARVPRAPGAGPDELIRTIGGTPSVALTAAQLPRHQHPVGQDNTYRVPVSTGWVVATAGPGSSVFVSTPSSGVGTESLTGFAGSPAPTAVDTRGAFYTTNFIIKLG